MIVTLAKSTPLCLTYLVEADAEAGLSVVIPNSQILADVHYGAMRQMPGIISDIPGNTQARARRDFLGDSPGQPNLTEVPHCQVRVQVRSGVSLFVVDADVDAVNPLRHELNVAVNEDGGFALIHLEFSHTITR